MLNVDFRKQGASIAESARKKKEDNEVFFRDHLKELTDECSTGINEITPDSLGGVSDYFEITQSEYKLYKFLNITFGKERADSEDDYVKIAGVCFYYCDFSVCGFNNVSFVNCSFVGCNFSECYTLGLTASFTDCNFTSRDPGKISIDDMPSMFAKCEFSAGFKNCDISRSVFDKCNFYFSRFGNTNMNDTVYLDCSFDTTRFIDCDLRSTKIINPRIIEFHIEDLAKKTLVNRNTFLSRINYNKKELREIKYAAEVYGTFAELFENSKIMDLNGEYFFLHKVTELRSLSGYRKLKSILGLITCGYGERPSLSLLVSLFLIMLCGTLYLFFGVSYNNENIVFHPFSGEMLPPFGKIVLCYHFSLVTFSTVGYGNVTPIGGSLAVSAIEMILGVIMVGIWVSTLVRKMVR